MKSLLVLLIVAGLGGAGYEFYQQQVAQADYVQKRLQYAGQITQLNQQNKQIEEDARNLSQPMH